MENDDFLLVSPTIAVDRRFEILKHRFKEEIKNYMNQHPNKSELSVAKELGINHSTFYAWREGNFKTSPKMENIYALANLLQINPLYLSGDSNFRLLDIDNIGLKDLIGEYAISGLKKLQESLEYSKEYDEYITYMDLNYTDIVGAVIGDVDFWRTLIHEAHRLIQLQTSHNHQNHFEMDINKEDIVDNPTRLDYEELVHHINAKALNKVFDKYISEKKDKLGITEEQFEESVPSKIIVDKN